MKSWRSKTFLNKCAGFTMIELIVVISIIIFLMAALIAGTAKLRERARLASVKTLLEKVQTGVESYKLMYRAYPQPMPLAPGYTNSQTLNYFLTTPFRMSPNAAQKEVYSALNAGPFADFKETEVADVNKSGHLGIVDCWGTELFFQYIIMQGDPDPRSGDPNNPATWKKKSWISPQLYSFGANKKDDGGKGDDLSAGEN